MILLLAALAVQAPCPPDAGTLVQQAVVHASGFDLPGAAALLRDAVSAGCADAQTAALYVSGLVAAHQSFLKGGSPESLEPVEGAITALDSLARNVPGPAEIARLTLRAAAAAAQSEREEMRVYIEAAVKMEMLQHLAGQPGAPFVSAVEASGDLWLQIYRYDDARRAYAEAESEVGSSPRILFGAARAAARLNDLVTACAKYRGLIQAWGNRAGNPSEVVEARRYVAAPGCASP
jgi:hypothetical protein